MLLILTVASTLWHASHAPKVHYIDLWSMDSTIAYLIIRETCTGARIYLQNAGAPWEEARWYAGTACALLFGLTILGNGYKQYLDSAASFLDGPGGCPLSGRNRLLGRSPLATPTVLEVALFGGLPVVFMTLPTMAMAFALGSVGSVVGLEAMLVTLCFGWTYRLSERFVLDGNPLMKWVEARRAMLGRHAEPGRLSQQMASLGLTTLAALASPTQILHTACGLCLLFGFTHARSLDATF